MADPLRIGVIGLGPCWRRRYRPALLALGDRFAVAGVCSEVQQEAFREARRLGCAAAVGPTQLLEAEEVEAVLLTGPQWWGLWPLELACRVGKPVLCGVPLERDEAHAEALRQQVQDSKLPVMMAFAPRLAPATARLRALLAGSLGPARGVVCDFLETRPVGGGNCLGIGSGLFDWCAEVLGERQPVGVLAAGTEDGGFRSVLLEFDGGRVAQVTGWRTAGTHRAARLHVVAERGTATAELPGRVRWADAEGRHAQALRGERAPEQVLLEQFHQALREGRPPEPGFEDAYRVLGWLRAAARSRAEGRRVAMP
jgi:predicted dehydrogenase